MAKDEHGDGPIISFAKVFFTALLLPLHIIGLLEYFLFIIAAAIAPFFLFNDTLGLPLLLSIILEIATLVVIWVLFILIILGLTKVDHKRKVRKALELREREIAKEEFEKLQILMKEAKEFDDQCIPIEMGGDHD